MTQARKRLPARFCRSESGREPVREWLLGLSPADRKVIGTDIKDVEFSWPIGKPLIDSLGHGLWEVQLATWTHRPRHFLCGSGPDDFAPRVHQENAEDPAARY